MWYFAVMPQNNGREYSENSDCRHAEHKKLLEFSSHGDVPVFYA